jgi:hypothetical protein
MGNLGACANKPQQIGNGGCITGPLLRATERLILTSESQQFDTQAAAKLLTNWTQGIIDNEIFPLARIDNAENKSTEATVVTTPYGRSIYQKDGIVGMKFFMLLSPDQHRLLMTYNDKTYRAYLAMSGGNVLGTTNGTIVRGLKVSYFHANPIQVPAALEDLAYSSVEIQFESVSEINSSPFYLVGSELAAATIPWYPVDGIKPLTKLTITPGTVSAFTFVAAIFYSDPTTGITVPYENAVAAEISLTKANGTSDPVVSVTPVVGTLGSYTIVGTAITSGTVKLNATATSPYYSDATPVVAAV